MTNSPDLIRVFETVYLPGFNQSMQRLKDARLETQNVGGATMRHLIAIPLFESLSWAYAMVEGLDELSGSDLSWIKTRSDRKFIKAILFAANTTKHDLLQVVDSHDSMMIPGVGFGADMFSGVSGEWKWRPSLVLSGSKDSRNPGYMSELGGNLIHKSLIRLGPIFADGIQKFSNVSKT